MSPNARDEPQATGFNNLGITLKDAFFIELRRIQPDPNQPRRTLDPAALKELYSGQVVQNLVGVVGQILPGDKIVSIRVYDGEGTEPLPPL